MASPSPLLTSGSSKAVSHHSGRSSSCRVVRVVRGSRTWHLTNCAPGTWSNWKDNFGSSCAGTWQSFSLRLPASLPKTASTALFFTVTVDTSISLTFATSGTWKAEETSSGVSTSFSSSAEATVSPAFLQPSSPSSFFCASMRAASSDWIFSPHVLDGKPATVTPGLAVDTKYSLHRAAHLLAGHSRSVSNAAGPSRRARTAAPVLSAAPGAKSGA
mmetsp:Transcript_15689/g.37048  ORF Transcript_15689/g.37048 Transcript_15689/m.37048 type:complete len:216 (-) Transcript_15689:307-954(-)